MTPQTSLSPRIASGLLSAALITLGAPPSPAVAGSIPLKWDPVVAPNIAGYRIYYGTAPGSYSRSINVGNTTSGVLVGLSDCTRYYIAVKSYSPSGTESLAYSNELSGLSTPIISSVQPGSA